MHTRRDFVKKAALLSGAAGVWNALPGSLQAAMAIDPEPGSTYLDAEHVVILMQENRSFDHCYGALRGVRGFNDPRAISLPNGKPVWLQTNAAGETYAPFRLDIHKSNVTWLGSLPHSWTNQVDARNDGRYDKWLIAKPSGRKEIAQMPLTLGYYARQDIPFYYALADAFTVCDQHFCSSLTGTTPNRLYLWTGTIREKPSAEAFANVRNEEVDYGREAHWTTFPERLEDHGVSWKIYQNELSLPVGFEGEEEDWLANFTDNPIEWFTQFHVRFSPGHRKFLEKKAETLRAEVEALEAEVGAASGPNVGESSVLLATKRAEWEEAEAQRQEWSQENYEKLSPRERRLHERAFCTNLGDPNYHALEELTYKDGEVERTVKVPKGDILHQFRKDVKEGKLPQVSWLVAPSNFSDHPGSAWYGAWYVSEALDILTQNPEVWKKTIFLLTYDENDGYFDHVPPFVPPHPSKPDTGLVSKGIDTSVEYVLREQDLQRKPASEARESPIGLGYRVPLLIASPWSRGGNVCSQVFDHTSVLQFLEVFLSHKTGKKVEETNISAWRRTVCGNLTSAFRPYRGEKLETPASLKRDDVVESIHRAKFQKLPEGYQGARLPEQERGMRPSCPLPYELSVNGAMSADGQRLSLNFRADNATFGKATAGAPFAVYARTGPGEVAIRNYAVSPGDALSDSWGLDAFPSSACHLEVYGPNGFYREFRTTATSPLDVQVNYLRLASGAKPLTGDLMVTLTNRDRSRTRVVEVREKTYRNAVRKVTLPPGGTATVRVEAKKSFGWYDFELALPEDKSFRQRYAGRVETGKWSQSDPAMGKA